MPARRALALAALALSVAAPAPAALRDTPDPPAPLSDVRGGRNAPVMGWGGVLFRLAAPDAREVSVVGAFNGWDPHADRLRRGRRGVWSATVDLDSGRWPYLFVVDGAWIRDPDNPVLDVPDSPGDLDLGETSLVHVRRGDVVLPEPHHVHDADFLLDVTYDRVNQVLLAAGVAYENRAELLPTMRVQGGRSFGRDRWLYDAGVTQPLFAEGALEIGAGAYRRNATPDAFRMGDLENSLVALFFREDWRDYHEAEGYDALLRIRSGESVEIETRWRDEDHRSVAKTTDWGIFNGDKRMRINAPVDDGVLRTIGTSWTLDTRDDPDDPAFGWLARTTWEWAGGRLGGDFRFQRGTVDVRRYAKLSPRHEFDIRVLAGLIHDGRRVLDGVPVEGFEAVPVQERFYLGGVGTLRATQFKSLAGDRMALGNAELRMDLFKDFQAAVFTDVGDAWVEKDAEFDLKVDAGIGFQDADSNFRINIARKMDRRDAADDLFVSARIHRMF